MGPSRSGQRDGTKSLPQTDLRVNVPPAPSVRRFIMNYGRTLEGYEADIRLLAQPRATGQKPGSFMISITPAVSIRAAFHAVP